MPKVRVKMSRRRCKDVKVAIATGIHAAIDIIESNEYTFDDAKADDLSMKK